MTTNHVQSDHARIDGTLIASAVELRILPSGLAPCWAFSYAEGN